MASPSRIGEDINPTHTLSNFLRSRYTIITASAKKIKKIANKSNGRNKLNISILCRLCPKMARGRLRKSEQLVHLVEKHLLKRGLGQIAENRIEQSDPCEHEYSCAYE